jgi:hypothetical protein
MIIHLGRELVGLFEPEPLRRASRPIYLFAYRLDRDVAGGEIAAIQYDAWTRKNRPLPVLLLFPLNTSVVPVISLTLASCPSLAHRQFDCRHGGKSRPL